MPQHSCWVNDKNHDKVQDLFLGIQSKYFLPETERERERERKCVFVCVYVCACARVCDVLLHE
jgi:hypothetical protein